MWTRIDRPFTIPTEVRGVLSTLYAAGFEAYLVGGCVRDFLIGKPIKDYDVATQATPDQVLKLFSKVVEVGKAFGVLRIITDTGREVEVATFRTERDYQNHRHPNVVEFSSVKEDSARRDFTVNALYFDLKTSQVLDFYKGMDDLKDKILRAIGVPSERFEEDALRLMRAFRFSARLGFKIEAQTAEAIRAQSPLIREISIERVRDELEKMLLHPSAKSAIVEMDSLGVFENVMPEIAVARLEQRKVWDQTLRVLTVLGNYERLEPVSFYWALFLLPTLRLYPMERRDKEVPKISTRLKLSNECA
ncbi:MAG: CCA tRNA nucleotidyltransferase, partial [Bdellovibrionales bacterium]|nr:CCA tRNA nucleotidyltransferase [Oligoflexia bacterium]